MDKIKGWDITAGDKVYLKSIPEISMTITDIRGTYVEAAFHNNNKELQTIKALAGAFEKVKIERDGLWKYYSKESIDRNIK